MMLLVWLPRAQKQRREAVDYIALENPTAALDQLDEIEKQTDILLRQPEIGRTGRSTGTRELVSAARTLL